MNDIRVTVCEVYVEESLQRDFTFLKTLKGSETTQIITYDYSKFSTSDSEKCHVLNFTFVETTPTKPGLYRNNCTDNSISE